MDNIFPIPVATRSKPWVCDRALGGTAGSNPAAGMVVPLVSVVCCQVGLCVELVTRPDESN